MSSETVAANPPPPATGPASVVVISHSPFIYLWPIWAVGFLMAAWTYYAGHQVAFVPPGTVSQRGAVVQNHDGPRDVLIAPPGRPLPESDIEFGPKQPRYVMTIGNNPGVIWTITVCVTIFITHVRMRKLRSSLAIMAMIGVVGVLAFFGLWDVPFRAIMLFEVHITGQGYFSISLILLLMWLVVFFLYDRQTYMIFSPGEVRVRMVLGGREKVYDTRGLVLEKHQDDLFRHWLLGFGSGDLTVHTTGTNPIEFDWPNVFAINGKLERIRPLISKAVVMKAQ